MVSVLVFWIVVLEYGIHKLDHQLKRYPKYHDMLTKVFGELANLGLGIKIMKELGHLDPFFSRSRPPISPFSSSPSE